MSFSLYPGIILTKDESELYRRNTDLAINDDAGLLITQILNKWFRHVLKFKVRTDILDKASEIINYSLLMNPVTVDVDLEEVII